MVGSAPPGSAPPGSAAVHDFEPPGTIRQMLDAVRRHLGMEVAYVAEFVDGYSVFREVDAPGFEHLIKAGDAMKDIYCRHILEGRLPQLIADTSCYLIADALPITHSFPIGSHISVPVRLPDGSAYGMFCCLSTKPDHSLTERDLQVMKFVADMAAHHIGRHLRQALDFREVLLRIEGVIARDEFRMVYQPILDLEPLRLVGFEALCRFPAEPYRPPDVWFNEAAGVSRAIELERAVLAKALGAFDVISGDLFISVNVSPEMILYEGFSRLFDNCPKARLVVEITEHTRVDDYAALLAALAPLRRDGVLLSIDDAGAGFASLKHILNLHPEIVKLDAGLTTALDTDPARRALAAALVYFARETRSRIIAEGIETESELAALKGLGVPMGQGYLLGRPADIGSATALWAGVA
jgi:EAL domain-containing protein (putative c-di-GMP-specific phosphodiesterase class I)